MDHWGKRSGSSLDVLLQKLNSTSVEAASAMDLVGAPAEATV